VILALDPGVSPLLVNIRLIVLLEMGFINRDLEFTNAPPQAPEFETIDCINCVADLLMVSNPLAFIVRASPILPPLLM
jgi:hypothetical protein